MTNPTKLARLTTETYLLYGTPPALPAHVVPELLQQRACYVTILENPGRLIRGMSGSPLPTHLTLAEEIIKHTLAALHPPLRRADLPHLLFIVGVVSHMQRISDASHLDPQQFGLYVRTEQGQTATVMPQRLGIETGDDQIATALREANINPRHVLPTLYRFRVTWYE